MHHTCAHACCASILRLGLPALASHLIFCTLPHEHLSARKNACHTSKPDLNISLYFAFAVHCKGQLKADCIGQLNAVACTCMCALLAACRKLDPFLCRKCPTCDVLPRRRPTPTSPAGSQSVLPGRGGARGAWPGRHSGGRSSLVASPHSPEACRLSSLTRSFF